MRNGSNQYEVSGPGIETKLAPVYGAALTFAQNAAGRAGRAGCWYVRHDDAVVAHIERLEDGVIETRPRGSHAPTVEAPVVIAVALDEEVEA